MSGQSIEALKNAGVDVATGVCEEDAREMNLGFFSRITRGRPWVRLKMAASLDGRTALANGESQWITGPAARAVKIHTRSPCRIFAVGGICA